jgi:protein dpy-30
MDKEYLRSDEESAKIVEQKAMTPLSPIPDNCLPDKDYVEKFILPHLEAALKATAGKRPKDPVEFFSYYLLAQRKK